MKLRYKHLLNGKWWEAYINWKLSILLGVPKWRYVWWISKCKMLKEKLNSHQDEKSL